MEPRHSRIASVSATAGLNPDSMIDVEEKGGRPYINVDRPGVRAGEIDDRFGDIVGSSEKLSTCVNSLLEAAATDASILLCGETGTGKELFARAVHQNSLRADGNFVVVDCTVLPESIVSSLLFGHKKGAFTGANKTCEGLIRQAHGGTLFLDEVGELSPTQQKAFLRVLQEHRFRPIGNSVEVNSDFRLVAATNRDLHQGVARGEFRQDLLYRLQAYQITLPPLRSRSGDISALANYHLARLCKRYRFNPKRLTSEFIRTLSLYPWPGNVRELINALEQALLMAQQETTLFPQHLPQHIRIEVAKSLFKSDCVSDRRPPAFTASNVPSLHDFRTAVLSLAEKQYLSSLVQRTGQDVRQACQLSGLSRSRLYSLLKKYQIVLH